MIEIWLGQELLTRNAKVRSFVVNLLLCHDSLIPMGQIKKCVIYVFVWYLVPIVLKTKAHPLLLLCDSYILSSVIKMREKWEGSIEV